MNPVKKFTFGALLSLVSLTTLAGTTADMKAGEQLFRTAGGYGCTACHGLFANGAGNAGGDIRGKTLDDINTSLTEEFTMRLLADVLSEDDRQNLALYLEALGQLNLVEWNIEDKASSSTITVAPDAPAQLVIFNKLFEPIELTLPESISTQTVQLEPYETKAFEWTPNKGVVTLNYNQNNVIIEVK